MDVYLRLIITDKIADHPNSKKNSFLGILYIGLLTTESLDYFYVHSLFNSSDCSLQSSAARICAAVSNHMH